MREQKTDGQPRSTQLPLKDRAAHAQDLSAHLPHSSEAKTGARIDNFTISEVAEALNSVATKNPTGITPLMKAELHSAGFILSHSQASLDEARGKLVKALPAAEEEASKASAAYIKATITAQDLTSKLRSPWYRLITFEWGGGKNLEKIQERLKVATREITTARLASERASAIHTHQLQAHRGLNEFFRCEDSLIALSSTGRALMSDLKIFGLAFGSQPIGEALGALRSNEKVLDSYRWFCGANRLKSANHAPSLISTLHSTEISKEELLREYSAFATAPEVYSADHAPTLARLRVKYNKPREEILREYNEILALREKGGLVSPHHAPILLELQYECGSPEKVLQLYREVLGSPKLENKDHAAALTRLGAKRNLGSASVMDLYAVINGSSKLASSDHAPTVVATTIQGGKPLDSTASTYSKILSHPGLQSPEDAPILANCAIVYAKPIDEVMAHYSKLIRSFLRSNRHAPALVASIMRLEAVRSKEAIPEEPLPPIPAPHEHPARRVDFIFHKRLTAGFYQ